MSRRGLSKFDTALLSNDGGQYSPSIRRLRQHYLNDIKSFPDKIFSPSMVSSSHHQSSIDLISTSLKCEDCQKHDGFFQCCHCDQRLCIRCCNKHYKKVTSELEHLHELSDRLLTKIFHIKSDLEKQRNETIEQCQKWRIDTINTINKAHTLNIQTIHEEYEILSKEYELFVEKEMSHINIDKNELIKMKKRNFSSLLSSPSSTTTTKIDSKNSMNTIKQRIETFTKRIDDKGKFSFQVKLPKFDIDDTLTVESCFGDITRNTSAIWQNEDFINDIPSTESEEISEKKSSPNSQIINSSLPECKTNDSSYSPSIENDIELQSDRCDSTYGTTSSSSNSSLHNHSEDDSSISTNQFNRRHTHTFHRTSSSLPSPNDNGHTNKSVQHAQLKREQNGSLEGTAIQIKQSQKNDGIIQRDRISMQEYEIQRRTTTLPPKSPSSSNTDRLSNDYPWLYHRTNSTSSFIQ